MFRKSHLALIAILVAALLGAFASSMIPTSGFQLSNVTMESFTISADKITIKGGPPSMKMWTSSRARRNLAIVESAVVDIEGMTLMKVEVENGEERTLKIEATSSHGIGVDMEVEKLVANEASFMGLTMDDIPVFIQSVAGTVILTNVTITALYMFAEEMTIYNMELTVS